MSPGGPRSKGLVGAGLPDGGHEVRWIRPQRGVYLPPPKPAGRSRSEQAPAIVVILLTLACTALCIFDLFLLASGY
jgi:hypothetical protein